MKKTVAILAAMVAVGAALCAGRGSSPAAKTAPAASGGAEVACNGEIYIFPATRHF